MYDLVKQKQALCLELIKIHLSIWAQDCLDYQFPEFAIHPNHF